MALLRFFALRPPLFAILDVVDVNGVAGVDEDGEAGDTDGFDLRDFEIGDAFGEDAVVGDEAREHGVGRRQADGAGDGVAVAIEREVADFDVFSGGDNDQGAAAKSGGGFDGGHVAAQVEIVGV